MQNFFVKMCDDLKGTLACDFAGIALQNSNGTEIRWPFVSGNTNEKYKHITVRFEKGIAGKVIASGNTISILSFPENIIGKSTDYPIMLAEKLVSVVAVPLKQNEVAKGVLMAGFRKPHPFSHQELIKVQRTAAEIEKQLPGYFAD